MNRVEESSSPQTGKRERGPQGTQLFSASQLQQVASDSGLAAPERASVRAPILEGASAGLEHRRFALRSGRQTIGRGADNDLVIDDASVSLSHAWIINQHGRHAIMNTLSTNGTFVNDQRIHETTLRHGDRVRLGQTEFVFLTREPGQLQVPRWRMLIAAAVVVIAAVALWRWFA